MFFKAFGASFFSMAKLISANIQLTFLLANWLILRFSEY